MKNPADLHLIIKKMTKAEKRVFKMTVNNGKKSGNNYTLLFDAIDAQATYNESKLLRKLKAYTFSKQISRTKYLLYEQILKVLRQLNASRSEHAKLGSVIGSVEVLFQKTLYAQAYETLKRAKKIAIAHELYGFQQEIIEWEKKLLPYLENHKTIKTTINNLVLSYEDISRKAHTETLYKTLHTNVRWYYDTLLNFHETAQVDSLFQKTMEHPLMQNKASADTFLSRVLFHEIHFLNANAHSNFDNAIKIGELIYELWQSKPTLKNVFCEDYKRQMLDFIFCKISHQYIDQTIDLITDDWKNLQQLTNEEQEKLALETDTIHFITKLAKNDYAGAKNIFQQIEEVHFSKIDLLPIHQRLVLLYHIAVYHFIEKRYGETWRLIEKIDQLSGGKIHPHIMKYVRLMELMVRYELEDPGVDDKDLVRINKHLRALGALGKIEEMLLQSIRKLMNLPLMNDLPKELKDLKQLLEIEEQSKEKPNTINHKIIKFWVEDKLTKKRTTPSIF